MTTVFVTSGFVLPPDDPITGVYVLTVPGKAPVSLAEASEYLKLHSTTEQALVQGLIELATEAAESYTGRSFRESTWDLLLDCFGQRIEIARDPVTAITQITRLVSDVATVVPAATYYLKRNVSFSEVLLAEDQEWPDDTDNREQAIVVTFTTGVHQRVETARAAILRMVAYLYENRGDYQADAEGQSGELVRQAGAAALLQQLRVPRF